LNLKLLQVNQSIKRLRF